MGDGEHYLEWSYTMSKSRAKKLRKRARKHETGSTSEVTATSGVDVTTCWYTVEGEERTQNLYALKVEVLGPFLFCQPSLCEQAVKYARELKILPIGSQTWPMFFGKEKWEQIHLLVKVTMETIKICEKDTTFYEQLMTTAERDKLCEMARARCEKLSCYSLADIQPLFTMFAIHVTDFASRAKCCSPGQLLVRNSLDQDCLVAPVKDRGNSNFKQLRYRAAIADYTTAIKLCPHSPVLYCNRALCYLHNDEHWCSCLDSYRALILKPSWEKPYYRCAEAWSKLGELKKALLINEMGQTACSDASDLARQYSELQLELSKSDQTSSMLTDLASPVVPAMTDSLSRPEPSSAVIGDTQPGEITSEKKRESVDELSKEVTENDDMNMQVVADKKTKKSHHKSSKVSHKKVKLSKPFTNFETLHCPEIGGELSCKQLRQLCNQVKLCSCSPASYFAQGGAWERLESEWTPPRRPVTDPSQPHKPVSVVFNEIWCPVLSDMEESKQIKPPKFHYLAQMKFGDQK